MSLHCLPFFEPIPVSVLQPNVSNRNAGSMHKEDQNAPVMRDNASIGSNSASIP